MEDLRLSDYHALGQFRYQIRRFLHFSEDAARVEGLEPQQHQMMLAIRSWRAPENGPADPTIGDLAEHLLLKHHSTVGLVDRLTERGLVQRVRAGSDRRQVRVHLTPQGIETLKHLSNIHLQELRGSGPVLVSALSSLLHGWAADAPAK